MFDSVPSPPAMERVYFVELRSIETTIGQRTQIFLERLAQICPDALLDHIGSTAVPGSLTKGDIDIQVRVGAANFEATRRRLAAHFHPKIHPHNRTDIEPIYSFESRDSSRYPMDIHLTQLQGRYDVLWKTRDHLRRAPQWRIRYDFIKRAFHGRAMEDYRLAKSRLFAEMENAPDWFR